MGFFEVFVLILVDHFESDTLWIHNCCEIGIYKECIFRSECFACRCKGKLLLITLGTKPTIFPLTTVVRTCTNRNVEMVSLWSAIHTFTKHSLSSGKDPTIKTSQIFVFRMHNHHRDLAVCTARSYYRRCGFKPNGVGSRGIDTGNNHLIARTIKPRTPCVFTSLINRIIRRGFLRAVIMVSVYGVLSDIHSFCGINKMVFIILPRLRLRLRTAADLNCFLDLESRLAPRHSAAGLGAGAFCFCGRLFCPPHLLSEKQRGFVPGFEDFFSKKEKQSIGTAWRKKFRAGFTGVPGTAIMRVGKRPLVFPA